MAQPTELSPQCTARLEKGEHVYTITDGTRLLVYGWIVENQEQTHFDEVGQDFLYPEPGATIYDLYIDPGDRGLYQCLIAQTLHDVRQLDGVD